jgi:hypothetical protein
VGAQAAVNAPFTISKTGQVVIKNSQGSTVLDAFGLKSTTQFLNGNVTYTNSQGTSSTSYVDIAYATITFTLPRAANVLIVYSLLGYNAYLTSKVCSAYGILNVDGSVVGVPLAIPGSVIDDNFLVTSTHAANSIILQLAAGSHTVKLQFKAFMDGEALAASESISYVVLGT